MQRTFNYTNRRKINRDEVVIRLEERGSLAPVFDVDFKFNPRFPDDSRLYVEAYYRETLQRFDFGTTSSPRRPSSRALDAVDLTGTTLFRVRVVDESGNVGRLIGAAEGLRPEGGDDGNAESLMILRTKDLHTVPWRVEVFTDGNKPILYVNNRIPDALSKVKTDPGFYALIMPAALQQVLHRLLLDEPDEEDAEAIAHRSRWIEMATELDSSPPETDDVEELMGWIDRVVEAFCTEKDLTSVLNNHIEEVTP